MTFLMNVPGLKKKRLAEIVDVLSKMEYLVSDYKIRDVFLNKTLEEDEVLKYLDAFEKLIEEQLKPLRCSCGCGQVGSIKIKLLGTSKNIENKGEE